MKETGINYIHQSTITFCKGKHSLTIYPPDLLTYVKYKNKIIVVYFPQKGSQREETYWLPYLNGTNGSRLDTRLS